MPRWPRVSRARMRSRAPSRRRATGEIPARRRTLPDMRKPGLASALAALALVAAAPGALAQEAFPGKPIHIIVPFTAGSATDIVARVLGERLAPALGQPV